MKNITLRNNTYYSDYRNSYGKRVRVSLGKDLKQARIELATLMANGTSSGTLSTAKMKYEKAVNFFIKSVYQVANAWKNKSLSSKSQPRMCVLVLKRLQKHSKLKYIDSFEHKHIRMFIDNIVKKISSHAANKHLIHIKRFFSYCADMDYIVKTPVRRIDKLKLTIPRRYHFTTEEVTKIMENAGEFKPFFVMMLETGLRPTDTYDLRQEHFEDGCLKRYSNKTGEFIHIPISKTAIKTIHHLPARLFPYANDRRWRTIALLNLQNNFDYGYVKKNNIRLHTFRHTFAMSKLADGVPKEAIQSFLGHESVKTTEIYANQMPKEQLRKYL